MSATGVIGLLLILIAFALEEFTPHTRHESIAYNAINLVGALFLGYYAWTLGSLPFQVLNAAWALIALFKLGVILHAGPGKQKKKRRGA